MKIQAPRLVYFSIFAISGFSGLIYESIWSHYLKLFLGHAAYAQSLVLIIFMGGMALGSWLASIFSTRIRIPILAYAIVEAVIGVIALVFHDLFAGLIEVFHQSVLPGLESPVAGITLKWTAASILILPQSILLGMTFPLMSAGIIRRFPDTPGGSIAMLYFTNSIGAAIGVLASGFFMIRAVGLPGTILTAGLLNIALAITVWVLVRLDPRPETSPLTAPGKQSSRDQLGTLFLVAAFITGAASFIYEISWIRMLSLVLGATTHSFELMLSAFITGLAFGGLWIKRRIDRIGDPVQFSGYVQLIMGALALLTIPVYIMTFDWMAGLRGVLQQSDTAYAGYTLASHMIALAVMLPTTFMAGMTLPLFTYVLLKKGNGEASIGRIYAANTVGAIIGVLFAVHIGLPALGLKNLIGFGAALDIVLGLVLILGFSGARWRNWRFGTVATITSVVCVVVLFGTGLDEKLLASGVYRYKRTDALASDEIVFYRDGKTASVVFRRDPHGLGVLATNGKPDASIQLEEGKEASLDESTMTVAAALPLAYLPNARRVANIGMGSGQTAHVLLGDPDLEVVDTIEIETEMVEASRNYMSAVWRAYQDPRSRIHIEDAKTFFSLNNYTYDIIIAEPSNPWVSGVSSLFSREFYAAVTDYLADDGVFVQWIQMYEFTDELAISILKALSENFDDFTIYLSNSSDVILVARKNGAMGEPDWESVLGGDLGVSLARVGIHNETDLEIRRSATKANILPFLTDTPVLANSDYFPYVDLNAGRALFKGSASGMFASWMIAPLPVLEMLNDSSPRFSEVSSGHPLQRAELVDSSAWLYDKMTRTGMADPTETDVVVEPIFVYSADWLIASQETCSAEKNPQRWSDAATDLLSFTLAHLEPDQAATMVDAVVRSACQLQDDPEVQAWLSLYNAVARRDGGGMYVTARAILENAPDLDDHRQGYAIGAAMLGALAAGEARLAYDVWSEFGTALYEERKLPAYMKLIVSISARFDD